MERGLTVIAVSGILLCIALAIALGVLAANTSCNVSNRNGKQISKRFICECTYDCSLREFLC